MAARGLDHPSGRACALRGAFEGVVHRDVKPENIFLCECGGERDLVKVLDFGIAKFRDDAEAAPLTEHELTVGTPAFISPEAAAGRETSARSDIYSLGAVLYFIITGVPPFVRPTSAALMAAHMRAMPVPPSQVNGCALPSELEAITLRCLAKSPARRFTSARHLAKALAALVDVAAAQSEEVATVPSARSEISTRAPTVTSALATADTDGPGGTCDAR